LANELQVENNANNNANEQQGGLCVVILWMLWLRNAGDLIAWAPNPLPSSVVEFNVRDSEQHPPLTYISHWSLATSSNLQGKNYTQVVAATTHQKSFGLSLDATLVLFTLMMCVL
jgi:hypothetical protein